MNSSEENVQIPDDFYGQTLRIALIGYLRPELKFNGLDELKQQINLDVDQAREILATMNSDDINIAKALSYLKAPMPSDAASTAASTEISFPSRI